MDNSLSWDHLRYFIAVIREGTVIGAAKRLGVSHATVLRNLSRLEACLGIRLFDRERSGYRPTAEAEAIYPTALAMEEQAETLIRTALGKRPAPEGLLRLATCERSLFDLMPLIREFRRSYPRIEVGMENARDFTDQRLGPGRADVAILATNAPPEDLVGRQLLRIAFACYASAEYLEAFDGEAAAEDCGWITWSAGGSPADPDGPWGQSMLRHVARRPAVVLQARDHDDALAAVRAGVGVSLLKDDYSDELVRLDFKVAVEPLGIWMLTHPDMRRSGRIQAFMDFLADRTNPRSLA